MEQPNTNEHSENTKYPIDPSAPITEENIKGKPTEEQGGNQANKPQQIQSEAEKIIVVVDKEKTIQPIIANIISVLGVVVSGILFYYTYLLFTETRKSSDASIRSAKAAETAIRQQRENDSVSQLSEEKSYREDSTRNRKIFTIDSIDKNRINKMDSINRQHQIVLIKEAQREFEIANTPFVQIVNMSIDTTKNTFNISYSFVSLGNFPAKLLHGFYDRGFGFIKNIDDPIYKPKIKISYNSYLATGGRAQGGFSEVVPTDTYNRIIKGTGFVYVFNDYEYISLSTQKHYYASVIMRIRLYPNFSSETLRNDVKEIK